MNKRGQTLIVFALLLPIILGMCAFVLDIGTMTYENKKLEDTTLSILNNDNLSSNMISNLYKKNGINIKNLNVSIDEQKIVIDNDYYTKSILGTILNINKYEVKIKASKNLETGKITIE